MRGGKSDTVGYTNLVYNKSEWNIRFVNLPTFLLLPNIFWFFVFPFEPFLVSFALLSYSICGFRRGCTCLRMIYKQRSLLSFVLVSIVERAQETFSVLVNVS